MKDMYLCEYLQHCRDSLEEWECTVLGRKIDCHLCLKQSFIMTIKQFHSLITPQSDEKHTNHSFIPVGASEVDDIILLLLSSFGILVSLALYHLHRKKKVNNFAIPTILLFLISLVSLITTLCEFGSNGSNRITRSAIEAF